MRRLLLCALLLAQGCAVAKEKVGDYVTEAALASVERKLDKKLAKRDLSIAEAKFIADKNKDGQVTKAEVITTAKDMARDYVDIKLAAFEDKKKAEFEKASQKLKDRFTEEGKRQRAEQEAAFKSEIERLKSEKNKERDELLVKIKEGKATPQDFTKYEESLREHNKRIEDQQAALDRHNDFKSDVWDLFKALGGLILAYFMKQIWGAKKHGDTKAEIAEQRARLAFLEKLTGTDLNQNGYIGNGPSKSPIPPSEVV